MSKLEHILKEARTLTQEERLNLREILEREDRIDDDFDLFKIESTMDNMQAELNSLRRRLLAYLKQQNK
jgi:hypothetical protein